MRIEEELAADENADITSGMAQTGDETSNGLPRTERPDAPAYLTRYRARQRQSQPADDDDTGTNGVPLYLRRFRDRDRNDDHVMYEGNIVGSSRAWAEVTRTKEIVPERRDQQASIACDIYLVRHGETQGYSTESGLTPLGSWQAHRRGQEIARRVYDGNRVALLCAPTNRAQQTAEHLRRGLLDNVRMFGRDANIGEMQTDQNFRNFEVATSEGPRDVTSAFRLYHREMEKYERVGLGERPGWLVDVDRFWNIQQGGGDPITHWLTMPMLYFEPPVSCVRRFWRGMLDSYARTQARTVVVATHSGPIRAFATAAMGYDPGEPFNGEFVRIRLISSGKTALVLYRNRVQEMVIPELDDLPLQSDPRFGSQHVDRGI